MPFRFGMLWPIVYVLWLFAFSVFIGTWSRIAPTREILAAITAAFIGVAVPVLATLITFDNLGYAWQGRYELPFLFALPLIASRAVDGMISRHRWAPWTAVAITGVSMGLGVVCLATREGLHPSSAVIALALVAVGWATLWLPPCGRVESHRAEA
jgi:hypothetical protein